MKILSIDPGKDGGYAFSINNTVKLWGRIPCMKISNSMLSKKVKNIVDVQVLYRYFCGLAPDYTYIEYTNPYGFNVAASSYSQGCIESVLRVFDYVPNRILSNEWKKYFKLSGGQKNKYLSCDLAFKLAPECGKFKLKDNGVAEAVLIGKYAVEKYL